MMRLRKSLQTQWICLVCLAVRVRMARWLPESLHPPSVDGPRLQEIERGDDPDPPGRPEGAPGHLQDVYQTLTEDGHHQETETVLEIHRRSAAHRHLVIQICAPVLVVVPVVAAPVMFWLNNNAYKRRERLAKHRSMSVEAFKMPQISSTMRVRNGSKNGAASGARMSLRSRVYEASTTGLSHS